MTNVTATSPSKSPIIALFERAFALLDSVPYWFLAIPLRIGAAAVFWLSGQSHLANWDTTIELFTEEYKVPLLPPDLAAIMAVSIEVAAPILLVAGLFTRLTALVLLGMTTVIEVFVYPQAWPTHIQWVAMLLVLLCRGPGWLSLDHLMGLLAGRGAKAVSYTHLTLPTN